MRAFEFAIASDLGMDVSPCHLHEQAFLALDRHYHWTLIATGIAGEQTACVFDVIAEPLEQDGLNLLKVVPPVEQQSDTRAKSAPTHSSTWSDHALGTYAMTA